MTLASNAVELPTGYYLDNFQQLLNTVLARYDDLLTGEDAEFVGRFQSLELAPARLLVRLYTRKGPYFRLDKLSYDEISDIPHAVEQLVEAKLLEACPLVTAGEVGRLLTLAELRRLDWIPNPRRNKTDLLADLDAMSERRSPSDWGIRECILLPRHWLTLRRLQLMYFGNEHQSLTDFVLSDLGLFQYESYPLDRAQRLFNSSLEIEQQLSLNDFRTSFHAAEEAGDAEALRSLATQVQAATWGEVVADRAARLCNRLAYRLEQMGEWELALTLFQTNDRPPARERRCRVYYKQGNYPAAWQELTDLLDDPRDATEVRFSQRFQPRLARKLKRPVLTVDVPPVHECRVCWPRGSGNVEQVACDQLDNAVWLENLLPLAVFGLIHWHWVFADVPGAFHHPFQQGPADLYATDFLKRRGTDRHRLYRQLDAGSARTLLIRHWEEKYGRMNPFVHWEALDQELILRCFDTLPWAQWLSIFQHLWLDLRRHRSGFPDLFQFTEKGYRFIEIKGPGDRLQDNQRDWLAVFAAAGIPAEVWYVDWASE